ncbi:MAG: DNA adenine methylase [bacterium]
MIKKTRLYPILKWAGGKEQELKYIHPALPASFSRYFEPFVGGGAVFFSINSDKMFINDKSQELIDLYQAIAIQDKVFLKTLKEISHNWKLIENIVQNNQEEFINVYLDFSNNTISIQNLKNWIISFVLAHSLEFNGMFDCTFNVNIENFVKEINKNLFSKINRMKRIESEKGKLPDKDILDNIEASLKSAFYMHFRHLYNNIQKYNIEKSFATAIFFFIRNFTYSGMFRYNAKGEFNVPYGGIGYNRKNIDKKIDYLSNKELIKHLNNTQVESLDFYDFLTKHKPNKNDFIFLDPPYDSKFSTYAQNDFTQEDQKRLSGYLISQCKAKWLMVIKNTDFIYSLYNNPKIKISTFNKQYLVSFQNRNDKKAEHLILKNY